MKKIIFILLAYSISSVIDLNAEDFVPPGGGRLMVQVNNNDTVFLAFLHDIWVYPRTVFKTKRQEKFYLMTVRDVKKTLPYAKLIGRELNQLNTKLVNLSNEKERKKYLTVYEKDIFKKHEASLKKMSINQGRMLMRLVDRECNKTSYELIKMYKGNMTAFFWQGIARMFGSNLKSEFNSEAEDKVIERVIVLVEAGQL